MPVYTVDIAYRALGFDYAPLWKALREANAQPCLDGRWLLDLSQDIEAVTTALLSHCAPGDGLFVTELAAETRWTGTGLGDEAKAWFTARSKKTKPPAPTVPIAARLN